MRTSRLLFAGIEVVLGLFWIGQGSGMIGGSAMTGSSVWGIVGIGLVVVGLITFAMEWLRRSKTTS
jgi:hypothetical protein